MPWERAPICITVPSECSICKSSQQLVQIRQHLQFYSLHAALGGICAWTNEFGVSLKAPQQKCLCATRDVKMHLMTGRVDPD